MGSFSPTVATLHSAAPSQPHNNNNMFRRIRNRNQPTPPTKAGELVACPAKAPRSKKSRGGRSGKKEIFNIKLFFRGQQQQPRSVKGHGDAPVRKSRGAFGRSTSTHFTRSTTNRSSAFMVDLIEPLTMSDFLMAEELAAFEEQQRGVEEYKEEITALDYGCNSCGHDNESLVKIDEQESYRGDDVHQATSRTEATSTIDHSDAPAHEEARPLHRLPAPESYFVLKKNKNDELGRIQFEFETLAEAQAESAHRQRPILLVEAEIPGDVSTGQTIFTHPLIVEAAESLFVTVQQRPPQPQDDVADDDKSRFFTNSSCRTRVRVMDDMAIDVLPPVEHMSAALVVAAMVRGLESYRMPVPQYLRLLLEEESGKMEVLSKTRVRNIQGQAIFGMFDTATAEVEFAGLEGVLSTRSGSLVRQQVVAVKYDSRRLSYSALVRHALRHTGANMIYFETNDQRIAAQLEVQQFEEFRQTLQQRFVAEQDADNLPLPAIKLTEAFGNLRATLRPKPALSSSILRFVPLTDLQATRANRLIHLNKFNEAMHLLSPRQGLIAMESMRAHHKKVFHFHDVVDVPIFAAWKELCGEERETDGYLHEASTRKCSYQTDEEESESATECLSDEEGDVLYQ